jgi:hypothetical protein
MTQEQRKGLPILGILGGLAGAAYLGFVRPQLLKWGTRLGEPQRRLPGDELIPAPNFQTTRAIDIDAPPEAVWPWLVQIGRDRTGWYGLDILTNNGIPSASYLRQDLAAPTIGTTLDFGLRVVGIERNRQLLISAYDLPNPFGTSTDLSILHLLERKSDGSTRLIVRVRAHSYGILGWVMNRLAEPLEFLLGYQQLNGLQDRAETMAHLQAALPIEHEISLN